MSKITKDSSGYLRESNSRSRESYLHVQTAEKKIGRKLGKKEVAHHADEDKTNNADENIIVLRSEKDHRLIHSNIPVEVFKTKDGSHVVIKEQRLCPACDRMFEPSNAGSVYCDLICHLKHQSRRIPTAEELKEMVWSAPTSTIASKLGVSDKAIEKWCTNLGVAKPPRGYWRKRECGLA